MRRTILLFIIFALLSSSFGQTVTSVVRHVRPEIAVMREIDSIVIKRGVMVANVDDPSDLRIGDGVTRGGHRVGIPWEQSYDFTGKRVIWGDGYTTRGYAGAWLLEQDGVPMASFGRSEYSFAIGAMSITGNTAYASVYWATRPNTNLVVYWATNMADWVDVTTGATLTTIGTRTDIALDITAWSAGAMAVSVPGWTGRYFQVDGRISATSLELGGAAISSWSEIVAGSATDATARAMATAVSGRVDAVEGRLTAVEGAVISNIPPGVVVDTDAIYTDTVWKAANAVQSNDSAYTNAKAKATSAVQPTDSTYTQAVARAATAYGWGDHAAAGYATTGGVASTYATKTEAATLAANWSTNPAVSDASMGGHRIGGVTGVTFTLTQEPTGPAYTFAVYNPAASVGLPVYIDEYGNNKLIYGAWNFSPSSYLTVTAAQTNYFRKTASVPSSSSDPGLPHQVAIKAINATSAWVYMYFAESNKWMRAQFNDF